VMIGHLAGAMRRGRWRGRRWGRAFLGEGRSSGESGNGEPRERLFFHDLFGGLLVIGSEVIGD
jgi:hypothetical protein